MPCSKFYIAVATFFLFATATSSTKAQELFPGSGIPTAQNTSNNSSSNQSEANAYSPFPQGFASPSPGRPFSGNESDDTSPLTRYELATPLLLLQTIDLTAQTDDLWLRLRNGFSMPGLNNEIVLQQQQWYLSHPDYLRRVVERSRPYIHHIVEELEKRGMPTELALLPIVESAFNASAYSHAKAAGLWQFIPATGKRFDLKQNWWHDQRRDIVASTEAALEYLQAIYEMHGDWHLALASYNWGEGAVKRAIEKNIVRGLPTEYSSLSMPEETRQYVPKLIALKNIFSSATTLAELRIPVIPNRPYFATVETGKPIDISLVARLAGMTVDEFVKLNPAHNRPVISGEARLIIPAEKLQAFRNNLSSYDAPLSKWQLYTTKTAERLDKLAPRFGISLADLKRINGIGSGTRVAAGASLLVPAGSSEGLRYMPDQIKAPQTLSDRPASKHGKKTGKSAKGKGTAKVSKTAKKTSNSAAHKRTPPKKTASSKSGKRR